MKTLIMLSAIPASGKSTWAKEYQKNHPNTYILNSDDIRIELTGDYNDRSKQKEVWELYERRIHEYGKIDDVTVILDALNDINEVRLKYLANSPEYDKRILVLFPSTKEKSSKYNSLRPEGMRVPEEFIELYAKKFEAPSQEVLDLVDEVITINW